jgi:ADP-heptose:LPS heptosyltransferase
MAFAMARPWERTYEQLTGLIGMPVSRRAATGQAIDPYLRIRARRVAARHPGAIGLLKFGGLGDMLQTTVVVRAAARKHRAPVVVFTPGPAEVFQWMPEVAEIVPIKEMLQDDAVRTLADCFPVFLDVRYISWAYGADPPPFALRHAWFYQAWAQSNARLATLGRHTTELMLESLGLPQGETGLRPHFDPREPAESPVPPYLAVANGVGSLGILKAWPQPYWAELAQLLAPLPLVQVGGADDPRIVRALDQRGLSLAATASILEDAQGLVSVEGGIAHLGAAVGLRSVVLYGPTDPVLFTYPGQRPIQAEVCPPCWWSLPTWGDQRCAIGEPRCVNLPKPQDVVLAIREHLSAVYEGP